MADWKARARNGVKITESAGTEEGFFERGPEAIVAIAATTAINASHCGKILTNTGGVGAADARPATVDAGLDIGTSLELHDDTGLGIRALFAGGEKVRVGNLESAANGYVESTEKGQWLSLIKISATVWAARPAVGIWTVV